jgi:integrase
MARPQKPWYRKQTDWWMVKIAGKQTKLVKGKENKKEAEQKFHELMAGLSRDPVSSNARTVDLVEAFLKHSRIHFAPDTHRLNKYYCQLFAEACGQIKATEIKPYHVSRWVDAKVETGEWGETTVYNARRSAFRVCSWATQQGLLSKNPLKGMPRPVPPPRGRAISDEEFWKLYNNGGDPLRDILLALYLTGARPKEVRELTWDQVQDGRWVIQHHKTRKKVAVPRSIYLPQQIKDMMDRLRKQRGDAQHVFLNTVGKPWTMNSLRLQIYRIRTKLGMSDDVCAYLCRHGFGTRAVLNGVDGKTLAELMGHSSTEMINTVYVHLADQRQHLTAAVEKINASPTPVAGGQDPVRKRARPVNPKKSGPKPKIATPPLPPEATA